MIKLVPYKKQAKVGVHARCQLMQISSRGCAFDRPTVDVNGNSGAAERNKACSANVYAHPPILRCMVVKVGVQFNPGTETIHGWTVL